MAGVQISGDLRRFARVLNRLQPTATDLVELNEQFGEILVQDIKERFETSTDPTGQPWVPLSERTLIARARRVAGRRYKTQAGELSKNRRIRGKKGQLLKKAAATIQGAKPMRDRNLLMNSIAHKATPEGVAAGTNKVQAALLNFGGKAGKGKKVKVPARPFIGISKDAAADIVQAGDDWVRERVTE